MIFTRRENKANCHSRASGHSSLPCDFVVGNVNTKSRVNKTTNISNKLKLVVEIRVFVSVAFGPILTVGYRLLRVLSRPA